MEWAIFGEGDISPRGDRFSRNGLGNSRSRASAGEEWEERETLGLLADEEIRRRSDIPLLPRRARRHLARLRQVKPRVIDLSLL